MHSARASRGLGGRAGDRGKRSRGDSRCEQWIGPPKSCKSSMLIRDGDKLRDQNEGKSVGSAGLRPPGTSAISEELPLKWADSARVIGAESANFNYSIDEMFMFREVLFLSGWVLHEHEYLASVFVMFHESVQRVAISGAPGAQVQFDLRLAIPAAQYDADILVGFEFANGARLLLESPSREIWLRDPYHDSFQNFQTIIRQLRNGCILEIGSRARSGNVYRDFIPPGVQYVGLDICNGPNVDVVGDAHELSRYWPEETFDAAYSIAVFEHLLMPWKVAIEVNKVLKPGAVVFIQSHQTFPLHEQPSDFWRFSDRAWHALFNKFTGFEIIETRLGESAYIIGSFLNAMTYKMDRSPAYMASTVMCRKIGGCVERWTADLPSLVDGVYPR